MSGKNGGAKAEILQPEDDVESFAGFVCQDVGDQSMGLPEPGSRPGAIDGVIVVIGMLPVQHPRRMASKVPVPQTHARHRAGVKPEADFR